MKLDGTQLVAFKAQKIKLIQQKREKLNSKKRVSTLDKRLMLVMNVNMNLNLKKTAQLRMFAR